MNLKLEKIAKQIDKTISLRTGLTKKEDIEIYSFFCESANFDEGIVMYGDVQHSIYKDLFAKASLPMQKLENAYWNSVANHEDISPSIDEKRFLSPLSKKSKQIYYDYFKKFLELRLVEISGPFPLGEFYPRLIGYNYFNDKKFYRQTGTKTSQGRELNIR